MAQVAKARADGAEAKGRLDQTGAQEIRGNKRRQETRRKDALEKGRGLADCRVASSASGCALYLLLAEGVGFEPTEGLLPR